MYQITLEVTHVTPQTWLEVGHVKTLKMDEALPVGAEINEFGHIAKVIDVQAIVETPWTEEDQRRADESKLAEITKHHNKGIE